MNIISHIIAFLGGVGTGAASKYFADKYTDKRRKQERVSEVKKSFKKAKKKMPELIAEIKKDLKDPEYEIVREFFILGKSNILNNEGKSLVYYYEDYKDLKEKVKYLEYLDFVEDITPGNCPMYRMSEKFVELVLKS